MTRRTFPVVIRGNRIGEGYFDDTGEIVVTLFNVRAEYSTTKVPPGERIFFVQPILDSQFPKIGRENGRT